MQTVIIFHMAACQYFLTPQISSSSSLQLIFWKGSWPSLIVIEMTMQIVLHSKERQYITIFLSDNGLILNLNSMMPIFSLSSNIPYLLFGVFNEENEYQRKYQIYCQNNKFVSLFVHPSLTQIKTWYHGTRI